MSRPDHAMILAAGFGTRMGALTADRPKPLLPVHGRPMIDLALDWVEGAGARHAVVNLHYRGDQIRDHLADRPAPGIAFSDEQPEILDTGGGVAQALPLLGDAPFFVLNSDNVFMGTNPLSMLADAWNPGRMDALLLLIEREHARAYTRPGDFTLDAHATPIPRSEAPSAPYVYTGAQILAPWAFADAAPGAFTVKLVWNRLRQAGRLAAVVYSGGWVDVGTPQGLAEAETALTEASG